MRLERRLQKTKTTDQPAVRERDRERQRETERQRDRETDLTFMSFYYKMYKKKRVM